MRKNRAIMSRFFQGFCGVLSRIVILCCLRTWRDFVILLQRGIAIPDCEAAALPGRFLPELGRSSERPFFCADLRPVAALLVAHGHLSPHRSSRLSTDRNLWREARKLCRVVLTVRCRFSIPRLPAGSLGGPAAKAAWPRLFSRRWSGACAPSKPCLLHDLLFVQIKRAVDLDLQRMTAARPRAMKHRGMAAGIRRVARHAEKPCARECGFRARGQGGCRAGAIAVAQHDVGHRQRRWHGMAVDHAPPRRNARASPPSAPPAPRDKAGKAARAAHRLRGGELAAIDLRAVAHDAGNDAQPRRHPRARRIHRHAQSGHRTSPASSSPAAAVDVQEGAGKVGRDQGRAQLDHARRTARRQRRLRNGAGSMASSRLFASRLAG